MSEAPANQSAVEPKFEKLDAQGAALRAMLKSGAISPTVAGARLDAIECERAELLSIAARRDRKNSADMLCVRSELWLLGAELARMHEVVLIDGRNDLSWQIHT
jgi:hypothetical protein